MDVLIPGHPTLKRSIGTGLPRRDVGELDTGASHDEGRSREP